MPSVQWKRRMLRWTAMSFSEETPSAPKPDSLHAEARGTIPPEHCLQSIPPFSPLKWSLHPEATNTPQPSHLEEISEDRHRSATTNITSLPAAHLQPGCTQACKYVARWSRRPKQTVRKPSGFGKPLGLSNFPSRHIHGYPGPWQPMAQSTQLVFEAIFSFTTSSECLFFSFCISQLSERPFHVLLTIW